MSNEVQMALVLACYRTVTIVVGLVFGIMGYWLFKAGIYGQSGDLEVAWRENMKLVLRKGAPGTFFALFGTTIIAISLYVGISFTSEKTSTPVAAGNQVAANDSEKLVVNNRARKLIDRFLDEGELDFESKVLLAKSIGHDGAIHAGPSQFSDTNGNTVDMLVPAEPTKPQQMESFQVTQRFQVDAIQSAEPVRSIELIEPVIMEETDSIFKKFISGKKITDKEHENAKNWLVEQLIEYRTIIRQSQELVVRKFIEKKTLEPEELLVFKQWYESLYTLILLKKDDVDE